MISAWCGEQSMVLGQFKTEEKSNEITAIPKLLNLLSIAGAAVTIDAMGCQKKIAKQIIDKKADYVLAVKDNQPTLHQEIIDFFARHQALGYKGRGYEFQQHEETNKGHGRIETRKYTAIDQILWMNSSDGWHGLKSIVMVESTRIINDKTSHEARYYISSLPSDIIKLSTAIRSHWSIENSLHWVLDVTFNEDQSRIRKGNAPQNIAMIRHVALNLLKQAQKKMKGISVKALRKASGWDNETMSTVLGI
jgi:predicted transposase YbfD/YdcC